MIPPPTYLPKADCIERIPMISGLTQKILVRFLLNDVLIGPLGQRQVVG
jgi:hypothetical protein